MIIMDSSNLLAKCRAGDQLAVEVLVREYQPRLFRLALSILDDGSDDGPADADEAAQDALLKALGSLDSYRGEAALFTWLYAITVNICRNRLRTRRRRKKMQRLFKNLASTTKNKPQKPEEEVLNQESASDLLQAVYALSNKHRLPIILRYYHGCSILEIAQILEIPEGTVHSRLNTARKQLKINLILERRKEMNE
jgi:RNA polymerase sigma-70 factor (ECF subfamily)